jgi:hypothetical protein
MMPQCHGGVLVGVLLLAVAAACGRAEGSAVRIEILEPATPPAPSQADQVPVFLDRAGGPMPLEMSMVAARRIANRIARLTQRHR